MHVLGDGAIGDNDTELIPFGRFSSSPEQPSLQYGAVNTSESPCSLPQPKALKALHSARSLLYFAYFFGRLADSCWQFTVVLFLSAISSHQSIFLVSTYYLTTFTSVCVFGPVLGRFIDHTNRWLAVRFCIVVGNGSVLLATGACIWLFWRLPTHGKAGDDVPTDPVSIIFLIGIHLFGSVAQVMDQAFVVAMERDWIVVLSRQPRPHTAEQSATAMVDESETNTEVPRDQSEASAETWLSKTNVALRQIDLACKVLGPALVGWVAGHATTAASGDNLHGAAFLVGSISLTSLFVAFFCTAKIYSLVPALEQENLGVTREETDSDPENAHVHSQSSLNDREIILYQTATDNNGENPLIQGLKVYMEQPVVWAGLALALLYLNSMSFGGIMTAYLLSKNTLSVEAVGLWRSVENLIGFMGTFVFSGLTQYTSVVMTGELSSIYLFACLSIAGASFFIANENISTNLLVISCAASRIGLWTFDITATLLYQEFVPRGVRGLVGGTQQSLNSFCVVLTGCMGLIFRRPDQFYGFAIVSYFGVASGMVLYTAGMFLRRDRYELAIDKKD